MSLHKGIERGDQAFHEKFQTFVLLQFCMNYECDLCTFWCSKEHRKSGLMLSSRGFIVLIIEVYNH